MRVNGLTKTKMKRRRYFQCGIVMAMWYNSNASRLMLLAALSAYASLRTAIMLMRSNTFAELPRHGKPMFALAIYNAMKPGTHSRLQS
jgi:hypothetical protein